MKLEYRKRQLQHIISTMEQDKRKCSTQLLKGIKRESEMFYLTTHSTHFIYGYMASYIWLRTILIVRKETSCRHIGYSYGLAARVLLYAPSHRQDNTYHGLCYTSRGALAGTRNSSMGPPHEGSIRRPAAPWANALPLSYVPLPKVSMSSRPFIGLTVPGEKWNLQQLKGVLKDVDFSLSKRMETSVTMMKMTTITTTYPCPS